MNGIAFISHARKTTKILSKRQGRKIQNGVENRSVTLVPRGNSGNITDDIIGISGP